MSFDAMHGGVVLESCGYKKWSQVVEIFLHLLQECIYASRPSTTSVQKSVDCLTVALSHRKITERTCP